MRRRWLGCLWRSAGGLTAYLQDVTERHRAEEALQEANATAGAGTNPAGPLTGVDGFYVSVNSANIEGAVALLQAGPEALAALTAAGTVRPAASNSHDPAASSTRRTAG